MGSLDNFISSKKDHEELVGIVGRSRLGGNSGFVHYSKVQDFTHEVGFSFSSKNESNHSYETSYRLADFIGSACKLLFNQIIKTAIELSQQDVIEKSISAKTEAEEVINFIESDFSKKIE